MIGGDIYDNDDFKLPSAPGRIWYEADINYTSGKRNKERILFSDDIKIELVSGEARLNIE